MSSVVFSLYCREKMSENRSNAKTLSFPIFEQEILPCSKLRDSEKENGFWEVGLYAYQFVFSSVDPSKVY